MGVPGSLLWRYSEIIVQEAEASPEQEVKYSSIPLYALEGEGKQSTLEYLVLLNNYYCFHTGMNCVMGAIYASRSQDTAGRFIGSNRIGRPESHDLPSSLVRV